MNSLSCQRGMPERTASLSARRERKNEVDMISNCQPSLQAAASALDVRPLHKAAVGWKEECGHRPQALSLHGSIIISFPLGPGRNEFGPAVVRVRTAKSAVAGDHLLHAHFVSWQTAIVRKEIALTRARAPRHLSGLADAKVEQHCHRYGHYDEH